MKNFFLSTFLLVSFSITADNHLPENFSKYQSNFLFKCDVPNKCLQAFNKYMESPEVSSQNFEADIFAILHNGWDDATHGIAFYYKDADEYAKSNQVWATSKAGRDLRKANRMNNLEAVSEYLTVHTVGVTQGGPTTDNGVSLRWSLEVRNPSEFIPLWTGFAKSLDKYDWSGNAYGLQSHMLGNNGNGITHEIWVAFSNQQAALAFLDGMYASSEFAEYIVKANEISVFKRSYMEVSLNMFNPD
jgi:hypothetical protein